MTARGTVRLDRAEAYGVVIRKGTLLATPVRCFEVYRDTVLPRRSWFGRVIWFWPWGRHVDVEVVDVT